MLKLCHILELCREMSMLVKAAATDMRYFARSKPSGSLVHKKNFSSI